MAKQDFYEILGVSKSANADELKRAYRKLAMQYHPDRNAGDKGAEQKFKGLNEAYDILKDDQKRAAYDRFGHAAFEQGGGRGPGDFGFAAGGFADIFDEVFGEFMGGGRRGQGGPNRGSDLRYNLEVSIEEAFRGKQTTIRVPNLVACEQCKGSGAEAGSKPITCPACHGRGRGRVQQGFFTIERTCPSCQGAGRVIDNPCKACGGQGRVRREKTLSVNIPAGVEDGIRIRLAGEGEVGIRGASAGDLFIFISVGQHRIFQRDGANIYCRVPLPITTAALGGTIEVPTVDGSRTTATGAAARIRQGGREPTHPPGERRVLRPGQGILRGFAGVAAAVTRPGEVVKKFRRRPRLQR